VILPIFLPHLGCTDRCIYCNQTYITDLGEQNIPAAIEHSFGSQEGRFEVGLYGGNIFGLGAPELRRLFSYFDSYRDRITNFRVSTKPVPLKDETIAILKEQGVTIIELGIPIFNNRILEKLNRKHTAEDLYRAKGMLEDWGFQVALQVMVGLPGETRQDIEKTAEEIVRLRPHYIRIYPLVVLEGTPLEAMYQCGAFVPIPFEEAVDRALFTYLRAKQEGILTAKMGLTENEVIRERVVAGQYHPAFGYMVKSRAFYLALKARMDGAAMKGSVTVSLHNRDIPHLIGERRSHIERFHERGIAISWEKADMEQGAFLLRCGSEIIAGDIFDALSYF
jgi:histone acetyltransferase (RNA polymerase elongator complex component)